MMVACVMSLSFLKALLKYSYTHASTFSIASLVGFAPKIAHVCLIYFFFEVVCPAKAIDCRSRLTSIAVALLPLDSLTDVFSTDVSLVCPLAVATESALALSLWMLCYRGCFDFLWQMLCRRCCWMLTLVSFWVDALPPQLCLLYRQPLRW